MKLNSFLQGMLVTVVFSILCLGVSSSVDARQERKPIREERKENVRESGDLFDEDAGRIINWRELDLSREQKAQVRDLRREFQVATASLRKELAFAQQDLQQEIRQGSVDREKIEQLVKEISSLKQRVSEAATENLLALKRLLSPEQQRKLADSQVRLPDDLHALQLTDEQQVQLRTLMKASIRQRRNLSGDLRDLRGDLRELLLSEDILDSAQLKDVQAQIAAKELELERARVDILLDIREVLTPEQRKLLK